HCTQIKLSPIDCKTISYFSFKQKPIVNSARNRGTPKGETNFGRYVPKMATKVTIIHRCATIAVIFRQIFKILKKRLNFYQKYKNSTITFTLNFTFNRFTNEI